MCAFAPTFGALAAKRAPKPSPRRREPQDQQRDFSRLSPKPVLQPEDELADLSEVSSAWCPSRLPSMQSLGCDAAKLLCLQDQEYAPPRRRTPISFLQSETARVATTDAHASLLAGAAERRPAMPLLAQPDDRRSLAIAQILEEQTSKNRSLVAAGEKAMARLRASRLPNPGRAAYKPRVWKGSSEPTKLGRFPRACMW